MVVQAEEMARAVRVAIDMNRRSDGLLLEEEMDTLDLDEIIFSKLADAVKLVETEAPHNKLESGHKFGDCSLFMNGDGSGMVILPSDFMRLVSFRMSDWRRTVFEAIDESDPLYLRQSSAFAGIRGNPEKPVCAIVRRSEGKVLEFYSCRDDGARISQASYLPYPRIDMDGGIDVSEECYRAAVYRAAGLALASIGDQQATTMLEISKSLLV